MVTVSSSARKLTFAADGSSEEPAWTPDGESVAFVAPHGDHVAVYVRRADGSAPGELLFAWDRDIRDVSFTADGATLLLVAPGAAGDDDIFALRLGGDSVPVALVATRFGETDPAASPDGRWLAYTGNESGRNEVYVRPLHDPMASRRQVSSGGGAKTGMVPLRARVVLSPCR